MALDQVTLSSLLALRRETDELAAWEASSLEPSHFVFATELPGVLPPHPDTMSHAFSHIRAQAGVSADVHLHSLRHFQATVLDPVISEAQKQSRLGWSTVHMARHYTDGVEEEDRRAAEHLGALLAEGEATEPADRADAGSGVKKRLPPAGSLGRQAFDQALDRPPGYPKTTIELNDRDGEVPSFDGPVDGRA